MSNLLAHDAGGVEYRLIVADNILIHNLSENSSELEEPLKEMIAAVKEDERALYKRIGVGDYAGFLNRLREIRVNDLNYLLSTGEIVKHYVKHYSFPNIADQDTAVDYLRQLIELNYDKISIDLEEEMGNTAVDISTEALEFIRASFKEGTNATRLRFLGKGKQKVGIAKIMFTAKNENVNGVVKPHISAQIQDANAPISKQLLSKIISRLGPTNDIIYAFPTRASFQQNVEAIVLMTTPSSWKEAIVHVMKQGGIELNRSYASLVGYLGELRALAILYRFFGNSVTATGGMKDVVTKQQISIDAVIRQGLNYLGFQVKNYNLAEGKATFTGSMSSANFISNRLCLTGTVGDILSDLLATYQFNQPFTDKELIKRFENSWMPVESYEKNIYTRVESSVNKLHQLFESRLGNILRVGHNFSVAGQNGLFGKPQMYYNSFFLIGEHYVPSSVILEGLLEQLTSGQLQKHANIQYDISNGSEVIFDNYYSKPPARQKALENQKIHYNITLDVQGLVKRALSEI